MYSFNHQRSPHAMRVSARHPHGAHPPYPRPPPPPCNPNTPPPTPAHPFPMDIDDNDDVDDVEDVDDHNLPPRVGKRNDCCDETKPEEEGTVADSVAIHTTIKQIMGTKHMPH